MMKKENPRSRMRCKLLDKCSEIGLSSHTVAEMTVCMDGKTEEEKEILAEQLLEIISTSTTEKEIIAKSQKLI
jgi:hypothetical protein